MVGVAAGSMIDPRKLLRLLPHSRLAAKLVTGRTPLDSSNLKGSSYMENRAGAASENDRYLVQILARALRVLWTLAADNNGWTLDELAKQMEMSKASLLRILRTLEADRVVLREGDAYFLGPRVLKLSHGYLEGLELDSVARPFMRTLAAETRQTVSLAVLDELEIVYIAIEKVYRAIGIQDEIGARHPANATALGKVMLASLSDDVVKRIITDRELLRLTHRTLHTTDALLANLAQVRKQGYAIDDEERAIGIRCVAAPIYRADGRVIGAISVAAAIFDMTYEVLAAHTSHVVRTAQQISERFGYEIAPTVDTV